MAKKIVDYALNTTETVNQSQGLGSKSEPIRTALPTCLTVELNYVLMAEPDLSNRKQAPNWGIKHENLKRRLVSPALHSRSTYIFSSLLASASLSSSIIGEIVSHLFHERIQPQTPAL